MEHLKTLVAFAFTLISSSVFSQVDFTKKELDLVKEACLAGSSFEFKTEVDGSISVKNLEGRGKLSIGKKDVTTVDLPDSDKREEFKEIRNCIKDYLINSRPKKTAKSNGNFSRTCRYTGGPRAGETEYFPPDVPITPARIGQSCTDGMGSFGFAIADQD